jgi:putative ABC transport system permease protein
VSHEYFSVLGITPARGRMFQQDDDVPNAPRVVVISDALWKRQFGADPNVVGRTVLLTGEPHEIIGVLPSGFRAAVVSGAEIWRPLRLNLANPARQLVVLRGVALLPEGIEAERAQADAATVARQLATAHPEDNEKVGFTITPLKDRVVGDVRPGLLALLGAVVFVLLLACANIANLLLARGAARRREFAVRVAMGAGRGRVFGQLLTESLLLAGLGGVSGILLGTWAVDALISIAPAGAPRLDEIHLDRITLAFTALLTIVTGLAFGLVPALHASRADSIQSLKEGARGNSSKAGSSVQRVLIAAEVALALVLLTGSGLLLQTFVRLQTADLGFDPDNVLVGFVSPPRPAYATPEKLRAYYDRILENASALPGVRKAALASVLPLGGDTDTSFRIEGRPEPRSPLEEPVTWYREVSASYFDAMGMKLMAGRTFVAGEAAPSVIVNETMARRFFPGENPIGHRVGFGGPERKWFTIVGVIADAKVRGARQATRVETFVPYWQFAEAGTNIVVKTTGNPESLAGALKQAVYSVDRTIPLQRVTTLSEIVSDSIGQPRFVASVAVAFATLALVLAAIGIYGVTAYAVSRRTMELGVRMALGARRAQVFRLVLADSLRVTGTGVITGIAGSLIVAGWLASLLFGVRPYDPATLTLTSVLLVAVALLATIVPARRATSVDPMVALRVE